MKQLNSLGLALIALLIFTSCAQPLRPLKPTFPVEKYITADNIYQCSTREVAKLNKLFQAEKDDDVADIGTWQLDHIEIDDKTKTIKLGVHPDKRDKNKKPSEIKMEKRRQYYNEIEFSNGGVYIRTWAYEFPPIVPNRIKRTHALLKKNIDQCLKQIPKKTLNNSHFTVKKS